MLTIKDFINESISEIINYLEELKIQEKEIQILGSNWKEDFLSLEEKNDTIEKIVEGKAKNIGLIDEYYKKNKRNWNSLPFKTKKERNIVKEKAIEELKISYLVNFYDSIEYDSDEQVDETKTYEKQIIKKANKRNDRLNRMIKEISMKQLEEFVDNEKTEMIEWFEIITPERLYQEAKETRALEAYVSGDKNWQYYTSRR
ncbi:MAG: hypothetical protein GBAus27B_000397 [Mycoplasmataceae bacterium]|nr:MAG: hypothetical protein GBAus27B_000397 [Mycoplasmataceae bacterium]